MFGCLSVCRTADGKKRIINITQLSNSTRKKHKSFTGNFFTCHRMSSFTSHLNKYQMFVDKCCVLGAYHNFGEELRNSKWQEQIGMYSFKKKNSIEPQGRFSPMRAVFITKKSIKQRKRHYSTSFAIFFL